MEKKTGSRNPANPGGSNTLYVMRLANYASPAEMRRIRTFPRSIIIPLLLAGSLARAGEGAISGNQIVRGEDAFEFRYKVTIPEINKPGRLWLPLAKSDSYQEVEILGVTARTPWRQVEDKDFRNHILTMEIPPSDRGTTVQVDYRVKRREKTPYDAGRQENVNRHLKAESLVPKNETLMRTASRVTRGVTGDRQRGEALYWQTLEHMTYDKSGSEWGRGDAVYACDARAGNCTDFHAYFTGLARAIGIPSRFAIGFTIPADADEGEIGGYHCWAEYYADGKWIPVDISEADKHPALKDYYLGHHPANRFQFTLGRDLVVDPQPASGTFNYLIYPLLEVDGVEVPVERSFSYKRIN